MSNEEPGPEEDPLAYEQELAKELQRWPAAQVILRHDDLEALPVPPQMLDELGLEDGELVVVERGARRLVIRPLPSQPKPRTEYGAAEFLALMAIHVGHLRRVAPGGELPPPDPKDISSRPDPIIFSAMSPFLEALGFERDPEADDW